VGTILEEVEKELDKVFGEEFHVELVVPNFELEKVVAKVEVGVRILAVKVGKLDEIVAVVEVDNCSELKATEVDVELELEDDGGKELVGEMEIAIDELEDGDGKELVTREEVVIDELEVELEDGDGKELVIREEVAIDELEVELEDGDGKELVTREEVAIDELEVDLEEVVGNRLDVIIGLVNVVIDELEVKEDVGLLDVIELEGLSTITSTQLQNLSDLVSIDHCM
jgi:hypothetical protein